MQKGGGRDQRGVYRIPAWIEGDSRRRIRLLLAVPCGITRSPTGWNVPRHFVEGRLEVFSLARAETTQMCGGVGGSGWWTDDLGL